MATPPDLAAVKAYLASTNGPSYDDSAIQEALYAETAAQARVVKPAILAAEGPYPADLDEALCARVAHNLILRPIPLGVQPAATDSGLAVITVGGLSRSIRRLEQPFRKVLMG